MSGEDFSVGAAIGITFATTLILSVALNLLLMYVVYKVWTKKQKKATDSEEDVPSSAKPMVSAKDSDVYEFPECTRYQGDPLATIQPNPAYSMQQFEPKKDKPVYANIK